ncbi:hypothetical protein Q9251_03100 [Alkalihalobacillus macyae]|uniref:hypothetical protein n=1 Tax=Guptibacillus hwajinpoensis TaxID=208199 RepID=UPI00273CC705|nr:hypothetical protein [Alkalihalobacillus macyae]MDP4549863.1 hypothetical protein [Alkalihalobacillus macyae]
MDNQNRGNVYTFVLALLCIAKMVSEAFFNFTFISDEEINELANNVAIVVVAVAVYLNNNPKSTTFKKEEK